MLLGLIVVKMILSKTYRDVIQYESFFDRFDYLKLHGVVGESIFGFNRFINQAFYTSSKWRHTRSEIIVRDDGCDLGCKDRPIMGRIHIHHINPVTIEMLENDDPILYDSDNLICVSEYTHKAIHYGDRNLLMEDYKPRRPGDTKLW